MNRQRASQSFSIGFAGVILGSMLAVGARAEPTLLVSTEDSAMLRYDSATGAYVGEFFPQGWGGLNLPLRSVIGPDGNIYAVSHWTHSVMRYSRVTGDAFPGPLGTPGSAEFVTPGPGEPFGPAGLGFGPDGNLYVAAQLLTRINRYNGATGEFVDKFVSGTLSPQLVGAPMVVRFGPDGHLYVAHGDDSNPYAIYRYDGQTGDFIDVFAGAESGLTRPMELIFRETPEGTEALVLCAGLTGESGKVLKYRFPTGELLGVLVPPGTGGLGGAIAAAIGPDGHLYIADWASSTGMHYVRRYHGETGEFIDTFTPQHDAGLLGLLFTDIPEPRDRNRFISVPNVDGETALRVTLTTMYDETVCPPRGGALPDLSAFDGEVRWLGPPQRYAEGTVPPQQDFLASPLQCCPRFRTWSNSGLAADFPGATVKQVFAYGPEVVPCSTYRIDAVDVSCPDLSDEGCYTEVATVQTSRWGDVEDPIDLVNFQDIGALVDCFKSIYLPDGWNKTRCSLRGNLPAPEQAVNFLDINRGVEAFKMIPYGEDGPSSCGPCE